MQVRLFIIDNFRIESFQSPVSTHTISNFFKSMISLFVRDVVTIFFIERRFLIIQIID